MQLSKGDIIVFNDDDRIVPPDFIASHIKRLLSETEKTIVIGWKKISYRFSSSICRLARKKLWR
ncbi:glycosyltransferase family A protein [Paenibacillus farraposensis]|uniref:Glycosyltransferase family A protein n=1 Tax=Paenibacillus farraposensis TaxID=2807095 RepID=A0ABW4DLD7_9BACL